MHSHAPQLRMEKCHAPSCGWRDVSRYGQPCLRHDLPPPMDIDRNWHLDELTRPRPSTPTPRSGVPPPTIGDRTARGARPRAPRSPRVATGEGAYKVLSCNRVRTVQAFLCIIKYFFAAFSQKNHGTFRNTQQLELYLLASRFDGFSRCSPGPPPSPGYNTSSLECACARACTLKQRCG